MPLQLVGIILPSLCSYTPATLVKIAFALWERQHLDPRTLRKNHDLLLPAPFELVEVFLPAAICVWALVLESVFTRVLQHRMPSCCVSFLTSEAL